LSWTVNHNNGDTRVEYRDSDDTTWIVDQTVPFSTETATVSGLQNGTDYDFRVVADTTDAETPSNELTETTVLPDEDQPVLGNGVEDEISVDRETVVSDTGSVRYQIRETGETVWNNTAIGFDETVLSFDTLTFDFTGLEDGEEYEVRGRTETSDATSDYTTPVSIVTVFPGATNLTVTSTTFDSVSLEWQDNADNEDGFRIERRDRGVDNVGAWSVIDTIGENPGTGTVTYTDTTVSPSSQYDYRVEAFTDNASGVSNTVSTFTEFETLGVRLGEQPNLLLLDQDEITAQTGIDAKKTHTGIADFQIGLAGNRTVEEFAARQDKIEIQTSAGVIFRGFVTDASHSIRGGNTTISGFGIGKRLEETRPDYDSLGGSLTYSNISVQEALRDYWSRTEFDNYVVYDQPLETVAENELVQDADTNMEWANTMSIPDDSPGLVTNGDLTIDLICWTVEGENFTTASSDVGLSGDLYSGGQLRVVDTTGATIAWEFTPEHDIPEGELGIQVRDDDGGAGTGSDGIAAFEWRFDGELVDENTTTGGNFTLSWSDIGNGFYSGSAWDSPALDAGTTYTIEVECTDGGDLGDQYGIDVLAPYDKRYESDLFFDDDNGGSGGYLDGPELFAEAIDIETTISPVSFNISDSSVASVINDTSNNQAISVSNDGGATYATFTNTDTVDHSYPDAGREARVRFTLGRTDETRTTATPQQGYNAQAVDSFEHRVDGNNLAVLVDLELSKNHFDNLQTLHNKGDFIWNIEHDDKPIDELVVESFKRGDQTKTLPVEDELDSNPEIAAENYYNSIYLQGALVGGSRPVAEVKDNDAIADDGREISPGVLRDLDITTEGGAAYRAAVLLDKASQNNALRGTKTYPADFSIQPGFSYSVDFTGSGGWGENWGTNWGNPDTEFTLEEVALRYNGNGATVSLDFIPRRSIAEDISELKRNSRQQSDRV
jgi:hypothetical protein